MTLTHNFIKSSRPVTTIKRNVFHTQPSLLSNSNLILENQNRLAEGVGFEPTVTVKPHTRSRRAESSALASLQEPTGAGIRALRVSLPCTRSGVWRSGPVRSEPVNRVRAGRQQLSAEPPRCRRSPGRHARGRVPPVFSENHCFREPDPGLSSTHDNRRY